MALLKDELEALMGAFRPNSQIKFSDETMCKGFLFDCCINEVFRNTKEDLGPCPNVHSAPAKAEWDRLTPGEKARWGFDRMLMRELERWHSKAQRVVDQQLRRLNLYKQDDAPPQILPASVVDAAVAAARGVTPSSSGASAEPRARSASVEKRSDPVPTSGGNGSDSANGSADGAKADSEKTPTADSSTSSSSSTPSSQPSQSSKPSESSESSHNADKDETIDKLDKEKVEGAEPAPGAAAEEAKTDSVAAPSAAAPANSGDSITSHDIEVLNEQIKEIQSQAEILGEEGEVDASMAMMSLVADLEAKKSLALKALQLQQQKQQQREATPADSASAAASNSAESTGTSSAAAPGSGQQPSEPPISDKTAAEIRRLMAQSKSQQQKLRVCLSCGALLSIFDSPQRLADHFTGRLHLGFERVLEKLRELRQEAGLDPETGLPARRRPAEDYEEERRRGRSRERSRERSRRRSPSRDHRRSRSRSRGDRYRRDRSRSRDRRDYRGRERDRERDSGRRRSRSRSRDRRRERSRSRDRYRSSRRSDRSRSPRR